MTNIEDETLPIQGIIPYVRLEWVTKIEYFEAELESQSHVTKIYHDILIKQMKAKLNE